MINWPKISYAVARILMWCFVLPVAFAACGMVALLAKEAGWIAPYRWICIGGTLFWVVSSVIVLKWPGVKNGT